MRPVNDLFATARTTMMKWPSLWLPALLIHALQTMPGGPYTSAAMQGVVLLTANLGAFIVQAGWLALIARGLDDLPPRMDDFKAGVNAHWAGLVAGNIAYIAMLALCLAGFVALGESRYTIAALNDWYGSLKDLPVEQLRARLEVDRLPAAVKGWIGLFTAWGCVAALLSFVLLCWQPLVVLRGQRWWRAWFGSARIVVTRLQQVVPLVLAHMLALALCLSLATLDSPLTILLGLSMFVFVTIFFKIAYAALVTDALPASPGTVDLTA